MIAREIFHEFLNSLGLTGPHSDRCAIDLGGEIIVNLELNVAADRITMTSLVDELPERYATALTRRLLQLNPLLARRHHISAALEPESGCLALCRNVPASRTSGDALQQALASLHVQTDQYRAMVQQLCRQMPSVAPFLPPRV